MQAVFHLFNLARPAELDDVPMSTYRRYWRNQRIAIDRRTRRFSAWPTTNWRVDGRQRKAKYTRFGGLWTAVLPDVHDVHLVVWARGVPPHDLSLRRVPS